MKNILLGILCFAAVMLHGQAIQDTLPDIDLNRVYSEKEVDEPAHSLEPKTLFPEMFAAIKYPAYAREHGIKGKVMVTVIVERDGMVHMPRITGSIHPSLDAEVLRVANLITSRMTPALLYGIPVRSEFTFPVGFYLQ